MANPRAPVSPFVSTTKSAGFPTMPPSSPGPYARILLCLYGPTATYAYETYQHITLIFPQERNSQVYDNEIPVGNVMSYHNHNQISIQITIVPESGVTILTSDKFIILF